MKYERIFAHSFNGRCSHVRIKRSTQLIVLVIIFGYMTILLYQNVYRYKSFNNIDLIPDDIVDDKQHNTILHLDVNRKYLKYPSKDFRTDAINENDNVISEITTSATTSLDDIFISVKTTYTNHRSRLALILQTWFQLSTAQTWFFTDTDDDVFQQKSNGHLVNTHCPLGHSRKALCCKMSVEFDTFLESGKKWFCHFDDDNYVNIPKLVELLDNYRPTMDWYLGKPSIASPLEIYDDIDSSKSSPGKISFVFATGGAGICLSRALAMKMLPIASIRKFESIGDRIGLPDDVTMGYIIEHLLNVPLTVIDTFHSHLEPMEFLRSDNFKNQVTFSYANIQNETNTINIDGFFNRTIDPTRFYSLHCHLFPHLKNGNGRNCHGRSLNPMLINRL